MLPAKLVFNYQKFSLKTGKFFLGLLLPCFFFASSAFAQAGDGTFSLESAVTKPKKGEAFLVQVFVNAPQPVNTVYLEIGYSDENLSLEDVSFTHSVFSNIVERDVGVSGMINLTAFTVTPYQGNHGLVCTLKFQKEKEGETLVNILPQSKIHLNDGKGTNVFSYQASGKNLVFAGEAPPEEMRQPFFPTTPGLASPEESEEQSFFSSLASAVSSTISPVRDFIAGLFPFAAPEKETPLASQDEEKDRVFFPEEQVVDYTKAPPVQAQRVINQLKATRTAPYFLSFVLVAAVGAIAILIWYLININRKIKE